MLGGRGLLPLLVTNLGQVATVNDADGSGSAQDGDLGSRPAEVEVGADGLGAHDDVGAAIGLAQDDRHQRHGGGGVGVDDLGATADDAGVLLLGSGTVTGDVDEGDHRQPEGVAEAYEAGELLGGVDVQGAGIHQRLIGDDPHRVALEAGEADHDVGGELLLDLDELAVIDDGRDHLDDVVGLPGGGRDDLADAAGGLGVDLGIGVVVGVQGGADLG